MVLLARARGLLKSTHPIPSFAVTTFTVLLAIGYDMPLEKIIFVGLGMLFQQFSVGLSNDWLDYERDRIVGRKDKATVRFEVSAKLVRNASIASAGLALVVAIGLGWATGLLMTAMLVIGWPYNLGLKSTALSVARLIIRRSRVQVPYSPPFLQLGARWPKRQWESTLGRT